MGKQHPVTPTVQAETQDESSRKSPTGGEASLKGRQRNTIRQVVQIQFNLIDKTRLYRSKRSSCWKCPSLADLVIVSSRSWMTYLYQASVLMLR